MMSGIEGPFKATKFCGAKVIRIQSNAGWQEQISSLKVDLVEDDKDHDRFITPETGAPMRFQFEGFQFDGIVQNWGKSRSTAGDPVYSVTLYSPVEIMEAVQIILDAYRGVNLLCPNLLNVFGYLEGEGNNFGGSGKNESGIAWYKIRSAIEAIQGGDTAFGPGIEYKGHKYILDMGAVPAVPDFYRLGGGAFISLNQAIRTVFEDSGYDYLVQLKIVKGSGPHIITFKSRSRLQQQPLGQIAAYVEGKENIISFEEGAELRNDVTCGVILGGEEESCISMYDQGDGSSIWQFWGFQQTPFLFPFGSQGNQPPIVESSGYGDEHIALLNAMSIIDIVGNENGPPVYACSVFEMRLAMVDFDSWSCFIARKRPEVADFLGLKVIPSILTYGKDAFESAEDFYADDAESVSIFNNKYEPDSSMKKLERLHNFVQSQATTYLGKQFFVRIPFWLKSYFEEETNRLLYNMEVASDGYYPDYLGGRNSGPLGLQYENFNSFSNDNGKFVPFLKFGGPDIVNLDLGTRNSSDVLVQDMDVFVRCETESRILFTPAPAILCKIDEAFFPVVEDPVGGIRDIAWLLDMEPEDLAEVLDRYDGEFPVKIYPKPFNPIGAAICLKSNEFTYGPWSKIGVPGKVKIEQNSGLVPWNYGGFDTMRVAAEAQLAEIGAVSQTEESGRVTFTGAPDISLGDQLNGAGPVVTSIDVSVGDQGVTTTYIMKSQTPVYGSFSKQNAERMRRLGTAAQDMRRSIRAVADRMKENNRITTQARWTFMQNASRAIMNRQTTNVLQAFIHTDPETGVASAQVSHQTFAGSIGSSNAKDKDKFTKTASMGLEGLMRPFSTNKDANDMPHFTGGDVSKELNPFREGTDLKWAASGAEFKGYGKKNMDSNDLRALGLRGPLVVVGWGYDFEGNILPKPPTDAAPEKTLKMFDKWMAGPVDLRWNPYQGCWNAPGILTGTYDDNNKVILNGTNVKDKDGKNVDVKISVNHWLGGNIKKGQKVIIGYDPINKKWYIVSAFC